MSKKRLTRRLRTPDLDVLDEISTLGFLFEAGENHLCSGDVLLRILQVVEQSFTSPSDTLKWRSD
jgi:hypothetical protein